MGPRLSGTKSTGVGISHSAPSLDAPRTRPSRASLRILRSDTPSRTTASFTVTLATSDYLIITRQCLLRADIADAHRAGNVNLQILSMAEACWATGVLTSRKKVLANRPA